MTRRPRPAPLHQQKRDRTQPQKRRVSRETQPRKPPQPPTGWKATPPRKQTLLQAPAAPGGGDIRRSNKNEKLRRKRELQRAGAYIAPPPADDPAFASHPSVNEQWRRYRQNMQDKMNQQPLADLLNRRRGNSGQPINLLQASAQTGTAQHKQRSSHSNCSQNNQRRRSHRSRSQNNSRSRSRDRSSKTRRSRRQNSHRPSDRVRPNHHKHSHRRRPNKKDHDPPRQCRRSG